MSAVSLYTTSFIIRWAKIWLNHSSISDVKAVSAAAIIITIIIRIFMSLRKKQLHNACVNLQYVLTEIRNGSTPNLHAVVKPLTTPPPTNPKNGKLRFLICA